MEEYIQVFTTTEEKNDAEKMAKVLVEKRLAACVQVIGPIISTYQWKGNLEIAQEWLCLIKTRRDLYDEVEAAIKEMHPYETPEIIAVPFVAASREYLEWLRSELKSKKNIVS